MRTVQRVFGCAMVVTCGYATAHNPFRRVGLLLAWIFLAVHGALLLTYDLAPCLLWARKEGKIEMYAADIATILSLVDSMLLAVTVACLGAATVKMPAPARDVRTIATGASRMTHGLMVLQAVPLRHTVAALEGLVAVVSITVGLCVAAFLVRPVAMTRLSVVITHWDAYLDQLQALLPHQHPSTSSVVFNVLSRTSVPPPTSPTSPRHTHLAARTDRPAEVDGRGDVARCA